MVRRSLLAVSLLLPLAACADDLGTGDAAISEGTVEGVGVLRFLNSPAADVTTLDIDAALDARAARNIVAHVRGPDGALGTGDDDLLDSIAELDADVLSIETSRSKMELLSDFARYGYPNEVGPGVYDIHSPRVATTEEMLDLLERAAKVLPVRQLWVNPDCGLKTRGWPEVEATLHNMVEAARIARTRL